VAENAKWKLFVRSRKTPIRIANFALARREGGGVSRHPESVRSGIVRLPESLVVYDYLLDREQEQIKAFAQEIAQRFDSELEIIDLTRKNKILRFLGGVFGHRKAPALVIEGEALRGQSLQESREEIKPKRLEFDKPLVVLATIGDNSRIGNGTVERNGDATLSEIPA
jgi:hypothetical protein